MVGLFAKPLDCPVQSTSSYYRWPRMHCEARRVTPRFLATDVSCVYTDTVCFVTDSPMGIFAFEHGHQAHTLLSLDGRHALNRLAATFVNCADELDRLKVSVNRYEWIGLGLLDHI